MNKILLKELDPSEAELSSHTKASVKFLDADVTAEGARRASVDPRELQTLWINTGSLCNLSCENCYIESTPTNDRLSYLSIDEVRVLLDEIEQEAYPTTEIGFTGGEPFLNKDFLPILELSLQRGFNALVLTNAMNTMLREKDSLLDLHERFGSALKIRVSLDHYEEDVHARERGKRSWSPAMNALRWLSDAGLHFTIAGRTMWGETEVCMRSGYARLFEREKIELDAADPAQLILFPEMDEAADVPEITTDCWDILDQDPATMMCATSRMVVKHKGDDHLSVQACTLLPYDQQFNLGPDLKSGWRKVKLNHPHCAKFCVLGGGSCSA